jgi:hypothetical protein
MKTKTAWSLCFAILLFAFVFQLAGSQSPNKTAPVVQENWETISNRWGSVPLEKTKRTAEQGDITAQYYLAIAGTGRLY